MKNWNATHTKELKKWFNLDNYRKFEALPLILLYHELADILFKTPLEGNEEFFVGINRKKSVTAILFWSLRSVWVIWIRFIVFSAPSSGSAKGRQDRVAEYCLNAARDRFGRDTMNME